LATIGVCVFYASASVGAFFILAEKCKIKIYLLGVIQMKRAQRIAYEMNNPDFLYAVEGRNFDAMADCYNEMMRYEAFGVANNGNKYFFAEVLDGYVISLSSLAKAKIKAIGRHFYYGLKKEYVYYTLDAYPEEHENLVPAFFKSDFLECEKVELAGDCITFTPKASKQLKLAVGDIVKLCFEDEAIIIDKYDRG